MFNSVRCYSKAIVKKNIEIFCMPRWGHITYRCKIWSDLFLRNKSYWLSKLIVIKRFVSIPFVFSGDVSKGPTVRRVWHGLAMLVLSRKQALTANEPTTVCHCVRLYPAVYITMEIAPSCVGFNVNITMGRGYSHSNIYNNPLQLSRYDSLH